MLQKVGRLQLLPEMHADRFLAALLVQIARKHETDEPEYRLGEPRGASRFQECLILPGMPHPPQSTSGNPGGAEFACWTSPRECGARPPGVDTVEQGCVRIHGHLGYQSECLHMSSSSLQILNTSR